MMSGDSSLPEFDTLYVQHRDRLYRAMVLVTDDRDLSLEAVDRAFARTSRRALRRAGGDPAVEVLRRAFRSVQRGDRSGDTRGFRLPDAETSDETRATVAALHRFDLDARLAVVASAYLGWDTAAVVRASGIESTQALVETTLRTMASDLGIPDDAAAARIAAALRQAGDGLSRPLSRLESVKAEGRLARLGIAGAAAAIVLVAVGGVGFGASLLRSSPEIEVAGPSGSGPGTSPATGQSTTSSEAPVPDSVQWVEAGLPFRQGELSSATAGPSGFVAVGQDYTDPGGSLRMLLSESGYDWVAIQAPLPRNGWVHSIVYESGRYFGVGSSYDELSGRDTPIVISSEDGESWESLSIPVSPTVEIADTSVRVYTNVTAVTGSGDDIIVIGNQNAEEDLSRFIREGLPEDLAGNQNWGFGPGGIDFYDFNGTLIRTVPPEELGIDPELFRLMSTGRPVAWRSSDGGATWEEGSLGGGSGPDGYIGQVALFGDTVVAIAYGQFGGALWADTGEGWRQLDLGRGTTVTAAARIDDGFLAAGSDGTGGVVWRSTDGTTWTASADDALAGMQIDRLVVGAYGVVAVGQDLGSVAAIGPAVVETDTGLIVEIDTTGRHVVTDSEGNVLFEVFGNEVQYGEEGGILLIDPETGDLVTTLDQRDIDLAWEQVYRGLEGRGEFEGQVPTWAMAVSRDGETWTRIDTSEIGQGFYPNVVALGTDRILLTGWVEGDVIEPGPRAWVGEFE